MYIENMVSKKYPSDLQLNKVNTVLQANSYSDVMFCLQSYQGLTIDRSLVY